ncbi:hypothetical protein Taro_036957 [Colocasia esculenta]|uniref:Uncharacterized protein n=1 Tax=Colocasia esculenta TaxID=4460 RepID=A0A843W2W3_COLES|nr:hypothetical protein [Colocasia esculenta]
MVQSCNGLVRWGNRSRRQALSQSDRDSRLCRDGLVNTAYRAIAFIGSAPESDRDKNRYNQLVGHVGIHGQRRLTEALNKDSLVWQKEYPTESSSKSRESVYIETRARHSRGILE